MNMKLIKMYKYEIFSLLLAIVVFLVIVNSTFSFYYVKGLSMFPPIYEKTIIINNKMAYGIRLSSKNKYLILWRTPKKGDTIILKDPKTDKLAVKKIFAIPSEMFIKENKDTILVENFHFNIGEEILIQIEDNKIPKGCYLVIGENKNISLDSRDYGFIHINDIYGKIIY